MIPISITYLFSFTLIIYKQGDKVAVLGWLSNFITLQWDKIGMKFEILIAGWKGYFFAQL